MIKLNFKRCIAAIMIVIVSIFILIGLLLTTSTGLNLVLPYLFSENESIKLHNVSGRILGNIYIKQITVNTESAYIDLNNVKFYWSLQSISAKKLLIPNISIGSANINYRSNNSAKTNSSTQANKINLPDISTLPVDLYQAEITTLQLHNDSATNLLLAKNIHLKYSKHDNSIALNLGNGLLANKLHFNASLKLNLNKDLYTSQGNVNIKTSNLTSPQKKSSTANNPKLLEYMPVSVDFSLDTTKIMQWTVNLSSTKVPNIPALTNLSAHISSSITEEGQDYITLQSMQANWENTTVNLQGNIKPNQDGKYLVVLNGAAGKNQVTSAGIISSEHIKLNTHLQLEDISEFIDTVYGKANLDLNIEGKLNSPTLTYKLESKELYYQKNQIKNIDSFGKLYLGEQNKIDAHLNITHIENDHVNMANINAQITGSLNAHKIKTNFSMNNQPIILNSDGRWQQQTWQNVINVTIPNREDLSWITHPITFTLDSRKLKIQHQCKNNPICISAEYDFNHKWEAVLTANHADPFPILSLFKQPVNISTNLSAQLDGNIKAQGELTNISKLSGNLKLTNLKGNINYLITGLDHPTKIDIANSNIDLNIKQKNMLIDGNILINKTPTKISGNLQTTPNLTGKINLTSANIPVDISPQIQLTLSPNISVEISKGVTIKGDLIIPQAAIKLDKIHTVEELPAEINYTHISKDSRQNTGESFNIDINIQLGDRIEFSSLGLNGKPIGHINLQKKDHAEILANGAVELKEAYFSFYGRLIQLNTAKFNYYGQSILNPDIEIRAIKSVINSTAINDQISTANTETVGIVIRGTPQNIQTTLFAEPNPMSDIEIITNLLSGSGFIEEDQYSQNLLSNLDHKSLYGADLTQLLKTLLSLQKTLSFDRISVSTNFTDDTAMANDLWGTEVSIGKYLTAKTMLLLRFRPGSDESKLSLNYQLTNRLLLQGYYVTNKKNSGVDLIFTK